MLHEEAPFYDNCISNKYIAKNYAEYTIIVILNFITRDYLITMIHSPIQYVSAVF